MIRSITKAEARHGVPKEIRFGINKRNPASIVDLGCMYYPGSGAAGLASGHR